MKKILKSSFKFPLQVISHTTRMLPQRAWAASIPTLLSHDAFDTLLTPNRPQGLPYTVSLSPLERFLGSVYLRRNLPRLIQSESVSQDLLSLSHHWKVFMNQQLSINQGWTLAQVYCISYKTKSTLPCWSWLVQSLYFKTHNKIFLIIIFKMLICEKDHAS